MRKLLPILILMVSACYRESADLAQSGPSESTTSTQPMAMENTAAVPPQRDIPSSQVGGVAMPKHEVSLTEYAIAMPQTLAAGNQSFNIVNAGKETHSFEIEGDVHARLPSNLPRGEKAILEVALTPGTYTVYCPIKGHRGKGMVTTVTVR